MKKSERSLQFKKHYLKHFEAGESVKEVTEFYGLSQSRGYALIREIAEENGIPYESLIYRPHAEHVIFGRKELKKAKPIDIVSFQKEFRATISSMDKSSNMMNKTLKDWTNALDLDREQENRK